VPQVNPATVILALAVLFGVGWGTGVLRPQYAEGRLSLQVWRATRAIVDLDLRDAWLLLGLALVLGWAVATAVEHSAWVPDTAGRLVPALALATVLGWMFTTGRINRLGYLLAAVAVMLLGLALLTPSPLTSGGNLAALRKWLTDLPGQTNLMLLMGLVLMFAVTGLWTSWWVFKRRNGLVALLPTGTILAVEIINDVTITQTFFTLVWLAAAAGLLLRLNFVSLKENWRARRLPHAADTGWTFGEVGVEATIAILLVAFIVIPPLSSTDISAMFIPAMRSDSLFHPFGFGSGSPGNGSIGSIGYSETVRPGAQLRAKSHEVMVVSGDTPIYYPYWRGIALGGWDGIAWYSLPSTPDVPVRQQPVVAAGANIPRDDLPTDPQRITILRDTFKMLVPQEQTKATIFSAAEILSVRNQPTTVRGIMTSVPAPGGGPTPALVNVAGDNTTPSPFDTIDQIRMVKSVAAPYSYSVTEAVPNVDVADLRKAGTDYPPWVLPYTTLYQDNRVATGYSIERDVEIATLARQIVDQAGATRPYDQAKAIESWFIQKNRFTYTLTPPPAPVGVRPLDYFLFTSRKGFCQDFSTAMNVMLRTLGIPSRQMSGFSLGVFDEKTHQYSVNALDAHSWVEVYFSGYGWLPFEPTPDGTNSPINRPATRADLNVPLPATVESTPRVRPGLRETTGQAGSSSAAVPFPDIWRPLVTAGAVLLLIAVSLLLLALRWLFSARDLPRIWRRLLFLGDRLNVGRRAGDTPTEFGGRLASSLPELDGEVRRLAALYTRASFRQGGLSADELAEARRVWARVRASYAGLVARAWREAVRNGRAVSAAEAEASRNRAPSRRR
jgi:transglutaminase-like putative cysteine protease